MHSIYLNWIFFPAQNRLKMKDNTYLAYYHRYVERETFVVYLCKYKYVKVKYCEK